MIVNVIKTRKILPPQDDLLGVIKESIKEIPEKAILVVTSKVVSIWKGRTISKQLIDKKDLIKQESEYFLESGSKKIVTITNNSLIMSSGVDESNGCGYYILPIKDACGIAEELKNWIKEAYRIKEVGVIIADSISVPMRRGSVGIAIGFAGIKPLRDYRQTEDIFEEKLKYSQLNIADSIATIGTFAMGEGNESTPLALINGAEVQFIDGPYIPKDKNSNFFVSLEDDKYDILQKMPWRRNQNI